MYVFISLGQFFLCFQSQYSLLKYGLAEVEAKVSFLRNLKEDRDDWSHPDDAGLGN